MILVFMLLAYGITNIALYGSIFTPLRNFFSNLNPHFLGKLLSCPMCFSTWVGFILSYLLLMTNNFTPISSIFSFESIYLIIFLDGCLTSGCVWLINVLEDYFSKD